METFGLYREKDLLPTPTVTDSQESDRKSSQVKTGSKHSVTLKHADGLLPPPTGTDYKSRGPNSKQVGIDNLLKLLPTPRAGNPGSRPNGKGGKILAEEVANALSSQGDFLVNLSAKPEKEKEQTMTAISGQKCLELLKISVPSGWSLKMFVDCLISSKEWYSNKCALTWKVQTTPFKRLLFQLFPSTRRTEEIGSGLLLRTPDANMDRGQRTEANLRERYLVKKQPLCLNDQMAMIEKGLLPTPTVQETEHPQAEITETGRRIAKNGNSQRMGIADRIAMLPTPATRDYKGGGKQGIDTVDSLIEQGATKGQTGTKTGLKLQPAFVEWMMGYPQGWTDLNYQNQSTELNA